MKGKSKPLPPPFFLYFVLNDMALELPTPPYNLTNLFSILIFMLRSWLLFKTLLRHEHHSSIVFT